MKASTILSMLLVASSVALSYATQCTTYCAYSAVLNNSISTGDSVNVTAYYFDNSVFPPSVYQTQANNCGLQAAFSGDKLTITGTVYDLSNQANGFFINIQSTQAASGTPFDQLNSEVYKKNGGYIDDSAWTYYDLNSGSLTGFGIYHNVSLQLTETMHNLQVGYGANGKNTNYGLSAWFDFTYNGNTDMSDINVDLVCAPTPTTAPTPAPTAAPTQAPTAAPTAAPTQAPTAAPTAAPTQAPTAAPTEAPTAAPTQAPTSAPTEAPTSAPTAAPTQAPTSVPSSTGVTTGSGYTCPPNPFIAREAIADSYGGNSYFAFIFNVTSTDVQYRFDFSNDSGRFQVNSDGTASLTGSLYPLSYNPEDGVFAFNFSVSLTFVPGTRPAQYLEELNPSAYVPNGPVNPDTWTFYQLSSSSFTVSDASYGINISTFMDMDFQVGAGANGKNVNYGGSDWYEFSLINNGAVVASGILDVDIDLFCVDTGVSSSTGAASGATGGNGSESGATSAGQTAPSSSPTSTPSSASALSMSFLFAMFVATVLCL